MLHTNISVLNYGINKTLILKYLAYDNKGKLMVVCVSFDTTLKPMLLSKMSWLNFTALFDLAILYSKDTSIIDRVILESYLNTPCYNIISCSVLRVAFSLKFCQEYHHSVCWSLIKHSSRECLSKHVLSLVPIYKTQTSIDFEITMNHFQVLT